MNIGITGLTLCGKSTLFQSFCQRPGRLAAIKGNLGIVNVPDSRLDQLSALFHPQKTTPATVNFEDCLAFDNPSRQERARSYDRLKTMDAFLLVVGAFRLGDEEEIVKEALKTRFDMVINDLDFIMKRIERLEKEIQREAKHRAQNEAEMALLKRLAPVLEAEGFLRELYFTTPERGIITNYSILTMKPTCYVLNVSEPAGADRAVELLLEKLRALNDSSPVLVLPGQLEAEIAAMETDEAAQFMEGFGIERPGRNQVIQQAYELLDLITFFTVGEDECRAWNIPRGGTALDAAATIHTDLARGFIRAEVIEHDQLLALGSLAEARKAGKLRQEGKTYQVKEGEIVHVLFNL